MNQIRPAAGYFRVSVSRDGMTAPEIYSDEIKRYCRYKDLALGEVFSDLDHSGFRGAKPRPGLAELVRRRLQFSAVIVPKLARLGRSVKDLVYLFDVFDRDAIPLVFLDMNLDTSTSQGRLLRHIMAAFAEYESDVKADYARDNHQLARSRGAAVGPPTVRLHPRSDQPHLRDLRARGRDQDDLSHLRGWRRVAAVDRQPAQRLGEAPTER